MSLEEKKPYQTKLPSYFTSPQLHFQPLISLMNVDGKSPSGPWLSLKKAEIFSFHIQCCLVISSLLITTLKDGIYETPCYILLVNELNEQTQVTPLQTHFFNTLILQSDTLLMEGVTWLLLFSRSVVSLRDPMDCSTPVFPVPHCLSEFAQTHVHRVSDAI